MKSRSGFTLLEMIVVLSIMGFVMMSIAQYMIKIADERKREMTADEVVSEILSFNHFVQSDYLDVLNNNNNSQTPPAGTPEQNENNKVKQELNPLYDRSLDLPIYKRRNTNKINDSISTTNFFTWLPKNGSSDRDYFLDANCRRTNNPNSKNYALEDEYLKCNLSETLQNGDFRLDRVDLIGNEVNRDINRVDYFLEYNADEVVDNPLSIEQYFTHFVDSFEKQKISFSQAHIVRRARASQSPADWTLIDSPNGKLEFGNIVDNISLMTRGYKYGVRFSFYVDKGVYLKADGSVSAEKLCWNDSQTEKGPCIVPYKKHEGESEDDAKLNAQNKLTIVSAPNLDESEQTPGLCWSKSENKATACISIRKDSAPDDSTLHLTEIKNGKEETGTLISKMIISDEYLTKTGNGYEYKKQYRTPVQVIYLDFKNELNPVTDIGQIDTEDNSIMFEKQTCPVNPEYKEGQENQNVDKNLHPRLVASISSFAAIHNSGGLSVSNVNMSSISGNIENNRSMQNIGSTGNVILQVKEVTSRASDKKQWSISALTSTSDGADMVSYINPKTLSITAMLWCDSIKQN